MQARAETEPDLTFLDKEPVEKGVPEIVEAIKAVTEDYKDGDPSAEPLAKWLPRQDRNTLSSALAGHENLEACKPDLWRLLFFLRHSPKDGSDQKILPKPMLTRQRVQTSSRKWHNLVMHQLSLLDAQSKEPAMRLGRQAAWCEKIEKTRKEHAPTLPDNLQIDAGDIIAVKFAKTWQPGLILGVWRSMKSKSGGRQLVSKEIPRGSMCSVRVVSILHAFATSKVQQHST